MIIITTYHNYQVIYRYDSNISFDHDYQNQTMIFIVSHIMIVWYYVMFILLYYTDHHIILYPDWGHYHDQYHNYDVHYHQNYNYRSVTMLILSDYHIVS